jgi:hypothetical protein
MNLPGNGSVVVIDDKHEEALPLLKVLSKNQVPVTYFMGGDPDELPVHPLTDIRLLFLDINLVATSSEKTIRSSLIKNLTRIVSEENGPYIMIYWSLNDFKWKNLIDELFIGELQRIRPIIKLNLQKTDYFEHDEDMNLNPVPDFLKRIEEKLKQEIQRIGIFHLFILWENNVRQSAVQVVKDFSSFYDENNWNEGLTKVVKVLADAYAGKHLKNKKEEILKNGLLTFNKTFLDSLENNIRHTDYSQIDINTEFDSEIDLEDEIRAKINSKLLLVESVEDNLVRPGNVYLQDDENLRQVLIKNLYDGKIDEFTGKVDLLSRAKCIMLEVSPLCDFAQDKWKLNRILPGIMWPKDYIKKIKMKADNVYISSTFKINGCLYYLIFDFQYFRSEPFGKLPAEKPYFRIRNELLVDIQSHLARHINRPGVSSIGENKKRKKKG